MSTKVVLKSVRVNYVNVAQPRGYNDSEPKYSVQLIIPKNSPNHKLLTDAIRAETVASFSPKTVVSDSKQPLRDGCGDQGRRGADYADHIYLQASSKTKPGVVLNRKGDIASDSQIAEFGFNGSIMHVSLNISAYTFSGTNGLAAYLNNVMLTDQDSKHMGGKSEPTVDFANISATDGVSNPNEVEETKEDPFKN